VRAAADEVSKIVRRGLWERQEPHFEGGYRTVLLFLGVRRADEPRGDIFGLGRGDLELAVGYQAFPNGRARPVVPQKAGVGQQRPLA